MSFQLIIIIGICSSSKLWLSFKRGKKTKTKPRFTSYCHMHIYICGLTKKQSILPYVVRMYSWLGRVNLVLVTFGSIPLWTSLSYVLLLSQKVNNSRFQYLSMLNLFWKGQSWVLEGRDHCLTLNMETWTCKRKNSGRKGKH